MYMRLLSNDKNNNENENDQNNENDKNRKRDENDSESGQSVDSEGQLSLNESELIGSLNSDRCRWECR